MSSPPHVLSADGLVYPDGLNQINANFADIYSRIDNATTISAVQWLVNSFTPVFVDASNYTLAGDQRSLHAVGRMVRAHLSGGYVYAAVSSSTYSAVTELTTVTLTAAVLDSTLDGVELGILTPGANSALPADVVRTFGEQTVAGHKDLTGATLSVAEPIQAAHAARKADVDAVNTKADTLNALVLAEHNADGTHKILPTGFKSGLAPAYQATDELTFSGGALEIGGKLYFLSAATNVTFASLAADTSYWVYVTPPATGNTLAAGDFSASTTAPTRNHAKAGLYNAAGDARCIFGFITDGSGNIPKFRYSRGRVFYDTNISVASITPSTSWTDVTLPVPTGIAILALVGVFNVYVDATAYPRIRPNGSSGWQWGASYVEAAAQRTDTIQEVFTDTAGKIEVGFNTSTSNRVDIYGYGYQLPEDM